MRTVTMRVNGQMYAKDVDERTLLLEFLRDHLLLTGTHNGCLEARCGCCAVLVNGRSVKSCNVLAVQADGADVTTVEGFAVASDDPASFGEPVAESAYSALQRAFHDHGAVQCGFCTPGMLSVLTDFLARNPDPTPDQVREGIRGNLCRCTGYQKIVDAALTAARAAR
jgi:aerobic carbon-monoxide dehydrogenase small subunit